MRAPPAYYPNCWSSTSYIVDQDTVHDSWSVWWGFVMFSLFHMCQSLRVLSTHSGADNIFSLDTCRGSAPVKNNIDRIELLLHSAHWHCLQRLILMHIFCRQCSWKRLGILLSAIVEYMCTAQATDHHHLIVETFQGWSALILSSLTITTHHLHHLQSSLHQHLVNKDLENQSSTQREEKQSISFCIYPEAQSIISEWQFENKLAKTDEN